jgi:DNA-binding transcriptional LysR family regulator
MQVFARVVETGSFSAAALTLNMTPSAVSKLISRLEARLKVLLLQRSTRHLAVTNEGKQFYESCVRILSDIEEAEVGVSQDTDAPHGVLRINVSLPLGTHYIVPLIPEFAARYPSVTVDLSLTDAVVDLQRERVDIALRMGQLPIDASYRARKLAVSRPAVVAAPSYIENFGAPAVPGDLASHRCLSFNFRRMLDEWPFKIDGKTIYVPVRGSMLTNNGETMRQLTLEGLGISRLGLFHVIEDLKAGRLVELLPTFNGGDIEDVHVVFSSQRHMPARSRVFIDFLVEKLVPLLSRDF